MTPIRRIVLVGFMGSGKSSVGRELARRLGWAWRDTDEEVERLEGMPVAEIFARRGEAHFREVEERVTAEMLEMEDVVVGTGGGWGAVPGRLTSLGDDTATVWLRVTPEGALERVRGEAGKRPLLDRPDALEAARALLAERESAYRLAGIAVDTEGGDAARVAEHVLTTLAGPPWNLNAEKV
ncbi:MAG: shikimate kinase [Gemmatimonadota bacterium]